MSSAFCAFCTFLKVGWPSPDYSKSLCGRFKNDNCLHKSEKICRLQEMECHAILMCSLQFHLSTAVNSLELYFRSRNVTQIMSVGHLQASSFNSSIYFVCFVLFFIFAFGHLFHYLLKLATEKWALLGYWNWVGKTVMPNSKSVARPSVCENLNKNIMT